MSKYKKLLRKILLGESDANISFSDLCNLLKKFGFEERIRGGHYIFYKNNMEEIINIQPLSKGKAKSYQVKQVRFIIEKYKLGGEI